MMDRLASAVIVWGELPGLPGMPIRIVGALWIDGECAVVVPLRDVIRGDHDRDWGFPDDASDAPTYRARQQRP